MVSNTKQTKRIRAAHRKAQGRRRKALGRRSGTPAFPVHPAGYDPKAADAKPSAAATTTVSSKSAATKKD